MLFERLRLSPEFLARDPRYFTFKDCADICHCVDFSKEEHRSYPITPTRRFRISRRSGGSCQAGKRHHAARRCVHGDHASAWPLRATRLEQYVERGGAVLLAANAGIAGCEAGSGRLPERFERGPIEEKLPCGIVSQICFAAPGVRQRHKLRKKVEIGDGWVDRCHVDADRAGMRECENNGVPAARMAEEHLAFRRRPNQDGLAAGLVGNDYLVRRDSQRASKRRAPQRMGQHVGAAVRCHLELPGPKLLRLVEQHCQLCPLRFVRFSRLRRPDPYAVLFHFSDARHCDCGLHCSAERYGHHWPSVPCDATRCYALRMKRRTLLLSLLPALSAAGAFAQNTATARPLTRPIPSSNEQIPLVGLGSWITFNVGNDQPAREQCAQVMRNFFAAGGRLIDSSPMYGSSQGVIGEALQKLGAQRQVFSADKVWTSSKGARQIEASRQLWRVAGFDLLQVHNLLAWQEQLLLLQEMKAAGRLRYVGITTSEGRRHRDMEQIMRSHRIDFVQLTYNLMD